MILAVIETRWPVRSNGDREAYDPVQWRRYPYHTGSGHDKILPHKADSDVEMIPIWLTHRPLQMGKHQQRAVMAAASTGDTIDLMVVYTPKAQRRWYLRIQPIVKAVEPRTKRISTAKCIEAQSSANGRGQLQGKDMARTLNDLRGTSTARWISCTLAQPVRRRSGGTGFRRRQLLRHCLSNDTKQFLRALCICRRTTIQKHTVSLRKRWPTSVTTRATPMTALTELSRHLFLFLWTSAMSKRWFPDDHVLCVHGLPRISNFANPNVYYNGKATGIDPNINPSAAATAWSIGARPPLLPGEP